MKTKNNSITAVLFFSLIIICTSAFQASGQDSAKKFTGNIETDRTYKITLKDNTVIKGLVTDKNDSIVTLNRDDIDYSLPLTQIKKADAYHDVRYNLTGGIFIPLTIFTNTVSFGGEEDYSINPGYNLTLEIIKNDNTIMSTGIYYVQSSSEYSDFFSRYTDTYSDFAIKFHYGKGNFKPEKKLNYFIAAGPFLRFAKTVHENDYYGYYSFSDNEDKGFFIGISAITGIAINIARGLKLSCSIEADFGIYPILISSFNYYFPVKTGLSYSF